jgi:predicted Zn-dependent peptidase
VQSTLIARATHEIYLQESLHYYGMMKSGYLAAGGYAFLRDYMDGLTKVTPQSIQNVAAQYLSAQMPVVILMSPPVEKTAGETATRSPNQYSMEKLENGLTVVIKENQDSRVIGIHLLAKERSLSEGKEKWGLTEILQRMLSEGGTTEHPDKALYQALESMGTELKLYDDPYIPFDDYYNTPRFAYMRLKLVDTFFEQGLKLLAEMVRQPNLSEKAFNEAKKQVIENAFNEVRKKLESLDDKKRETYIKKLLEKAKNDIEMAYVYCNKKDTKFLKGLNLEAINIIGGLIAENKEKTIRVDYSFETILQSIKENELQNINKILFS